MWPDLARSGQIWDVWENFFFQKKKKNFQIWPDLGGPDLEIWPDLAASVDLEIWPVFFFPQISGYCLPGKGTLEFFFSPLKRANFDDLRPFKAKFGTFEHLWGSKTWFCEPEISWFLPKTSRFLKNLEKKIFFFSGKILTPEQGFCVPKSAKKKNKKTQESGVLTIWYRHMQYRGPQFRLFLSNFLHNFFFFDFWQRQISGKKNSPLIVGPWVSKDAKNTKILMF